MAFSAIVMGLNLQKLVIPGSEIQSHLEKIKLACLNLERAMIIYKFIIYMNLEPET